MRFPVAAMFQHRKTGRKRRGKISKTVLADIQLQRRWQYPADALDRKWDWFGIWLSCGTMPNRFECYSAKIKDELHGLMALDLRGRKIGGERALVVDYLATNPKNRNNEAGFKYIGIGLMAIAVARSVDLGFQGRVWLESLPDPKTVTFYENLGMTQLPFISLTDGNLFFIFEINRAIEFLKAATDEKWVKIEK